MTAASPFDPRSGAGTPVWYNPDRRDGEAQVGGVAGGVAVGQQKAAVDIRQGTPDDEAFVFATWLRSYRDSPFAHRVRKGTFNRRHHALIESLLDRGALVHVATPAEDPGVILGYLVREDLDDRQVLHYAYVKRAFRRLGVFSRLTSAIPGRLADCVVSHLTRDGELALRGLGADLDYDPYLAGPRFVVEAA